MLISDELRIYVRLTVNTAVAVTAAPTPLSALQVYVPAWFLVMCTRLAFPAVCVMTLLLLSVILIVGAGLAAFTLHSAVAFCVSLTVLGVIEMLIIVGGTKKVRFAKIGNVN